MTTLAEDTFLSDNNLFNGIGDERASDIDDLEREIEMIANK